MMFSNLGKEFTNDIALPIDTRKVTKNGDGIDCEPAAAGTDQARLEKKYRFVFFTVIVGTVTDGTHVVTAETSSTKTGGFTEVARTGPLAANTVQILAVRRSSAA